MLNKSKGNMYSWVTDTWNPIKGVCSHGCSYCFMRKWGHLKPARLEDSEFKTDLGKGNFIFVGSSTDDWAAAIPDDWIQKTLDYCDKFENQYLFQSKNPSRILEFCDHPVFRRSVAFSSRSTYRSTAARPCANFLAFATSFSSCTGISRTSATRSMLMTVPP